MQYGKYLGLPLIWPVLKEYAPSKENLGPIVPLILPVCWPGNSSPTIYILVRPLMEYAAPVWDPHLRKDQDFLESTQKFACKMITKSWDKGYNEFLNMTNLPSLAGRRLYLRLCSLYKIVYLKSLDRTQAHLLLCTSPLHILIVLQTLLSLILYHTGTHFQSQLFQLPSLQLLNTHLNSILCTK